MNIVLGAFFIYFLLLLACEPFYESFSQIELILSIIVAIITTVTMPILRKIFFGIGKSNFGVQLTKSESKQVDELRESTINELENINKNYPYPSSKDGKDLMMLNTDKYNYLLNLSDTFNEDFEGKLEKLKKEFGKKGWLGRITSSSISNNKIFMKKLRECVVYFGFDFYNLIDEIPKNYRYSDKDNELRLATHKLIREYEELKNEFMNEFIATKLGFDGENRTIKEMKKFLTEGKIIEDVRLELNNEDRDSANPDIVYVGPNGIFCIEVKNYGSGGSYDLRITKDGQWKTISKNGEEKAMKSVTSQINHHKYVFTTFINNKLKDKYGKNAPNINIENFIVIANDKVSIENKCEGLNIMRTSMVHHNIQKRPTILSKELQQNIIEIIEEFRVESLKYPVKDYKKAINDLKTKTKRLYLIYGVYNNMTHELLVLSGTLDTYIYGGKKEKFIPIEFYSCILLCLDIIAMLFLFGYVNYTTILNLANEGGPLGYFEPLLFMIPIIHMWYRTWIRPYFTKNKLPKYF